MTDTSTTSAPTLAVDEKAAAKALSVSVAWLRKDRRTSRFIPFYRLGGCVRYSPDGILKALADLQEGGAAPRGRRHGVGGVRGQPAAHAAADEIPGQKSRDRHVGTTPAATTALDLQKGGAARPARRGAQ